MCTLFRLIYIDLKIVGVISAAPCINTCLTVYCCEQCSCFKFHHSLSLSLSVSLRTALIFVYYVNEIGNGTWKWRQQRRRWGRRWRRWGRRWGRRRQTHSCRHRVRTRLRERRRRWVWRWWRVCVAEAVGAEEGAGTIKMDTEYS